MCGTVLIVVTLTALSVSAANGSPDLSVKSQRRTAPVSASHKAKHPANHATGRTAAHASKRTATHKTGRTPLHASGHAVRRASKNRLRPLHSMGGEEHAASPRQPSRFHSARKSTDLRIRFGQQISSSRKLPPGRGNRYSESPCHARRQFRGARRGLQCRRRCVAVTLRSNGKTRRPRTTIWSGSRTTTTWPIALRASMLVPVPASASLTVNGNLSENYRYCRPWTARFPRRSGACS